MHKILLELGELSLGESALVKEIRHLFSEIYTFHVEPNPDCYKSAKQLMLFLESLRDDAASLTEEECGQVLFHLTKWRKQHLKRMLTSAGDDDRGSLFLAGNQFVDMKEAREMIRTSKKVYDTLKRLCEDRQEITQK